MIKKIISIICLFTIIIGLTVFPSVSSATAETDDIHTLLIKDTKNFEDIVTYVKGHLAEGPIQEVKEIGLISYEGKSINNINLPDVISSAIEEQGSLPKTKVETDNEDFQLDGILKEDFAKNNWYIQDVTHNFDSFNIETGDNVKIALIDSGLDVNHPYLKDNIDLQKARSFVEGDKNLNDEFGHGTSVAGVIKSIAPHIKIVPYKVIGKTDGESLWTIQAIIQAANDGTDVINLSLGTYKSKTLQDEKVTIKAYKKAIQYAKSKGITVVASSGNDHYNLDLLKQNEKKYHLPGGLPQLITVGSSMKDDTLAPYSNFGKKVDFIAPTGYLGKNYDKTGEIDIRDFIITTFPTNKENTALDKLAEIPNGYTLSFGTSLAAPQVSATAALIIAKYQDVHQKKPNEAQVSNYLKRGAIDLGPKGKDIYFGYGKINAYNSLLSIK
ncbi:hypothetical protein C3744_27385 [Priestia megaterium]|uniref:Peptidase S8/S53 domain-containing protein n=1 Tax=Priestia megaterium TaxID=1404 RepID=A0A3D8WUM7_PRIMG|nr:S8 family serine peptidase [Priestia megaterium]MDH3169152.1 S8 family serine peptidase [Priestia megaterium]MDH3169199.1 S8 family serine peptidase [Priestia megaterium]RDZ07681.1 hypothetical protein C3744_27385 [Priestia megaterium]